MVYDWENKEEICHRMYADEKKSLIEIMDYMKEHHKFAPRHTYFKRWDFPSKRSAHKNVTLVQHVKELWDCNTSQQETLRALNEERFDIKKRELMRVRAKNQRLLRVPNGMNQDVISQRQQTLYRDSQMADIEATHQSRAESPPLSPEASLPVDPPRPPRFPSETTINESKAYLSLDNRLYQDIRTRFQRICETDIIKKTIASPERWEAAKDRLVQENPHLQSVFWASGDNQEAKKLALNIVCIDVTKRMRILKRRITNVEAKNALSINPEESRQLRNAFCQVFKANHFISKLEAGEKHWKELKPQ
ncbi:hypothetical protein BDZ45DRAFT_695898 [Acephala macrosclerotiorum]|nr:hypothetical protein BDZ45DRAFT_695898 [Acephala macrosclerotiorum]